MTKFTIFLLLFATLSLSAQKKVYFGELGEPEAKYKLRYQHPAEYFEESLPLGNGRMGACVFGGVSQEKIYLNDLTLWSGGPVNANMNPEAYKHVPEIREALAREDYRLADSLNRHLQGKFSESYAPLGTLLLDFNHTSRFGLPEPEVHIYNRWLDIDRAIALMNYDIDRTVGYTREAFVSYPHQVMAIKIVSDRKDSLKFELKFHSLLRYTTSTKDNVLKIKGYAPVHAEPSYRGNMPNAIVFEEGKGTRFTTLIQIKNTGGQIIRTDSSLRLVGGTEAIIYVAIATSFNGFDKDPVTQGADDEALAMQRLKKGTSVSYDKLKAAHIADYQSFFNRVTLDLGPSKPLSRATDVRLQVYAGGKEDKGLEELYFQYGRYLLISSSRTPGVPANLQGLWNPHIRPPWSCNYTTNINAEENYWLAEVTNLSELHKPLLGFIKNLSQTGAVTARTFYGSRGWAVGHNSDIWAMSNPVGDFGKGSPQWANWNMGGAWLSTHLWEHYTFTQDKAFLQNEAYGLMKGAARFCLDWMVSDKQGNLITSPSTSPENVFITPDGFQGATLYGATADLAMIRELFLQTVAASEVLNTDAAFRDSLQKALAKLYPYQIGKKGNLQEWYYDWEDAEPQHRHQSHLYGLYPGHHINPQLTPELAAACRKTLDIKGDETTGWSKGWRINLWARLQDGDRAYKMYRELLKYVPPDGSDVNYGGGGGTYPNLFDAHPPFQIDGNFGGAAAVAEMLIQSDESHIWLLPALPTVWESGSFTGLCARGGFEVSVKWSDHKPVEVTVYSKTGGNTTLLCDGREVELSLKKGERKVVQW